MNIVIRSERSYSWANLRGVPIAGGKVALRKSPVRDEGNLLEVYSVVHRRKCNNSAGHGT